MYRDKITACVVLNYNDFVQTSAFIESLSGYHALDYIIVVDNCSTDQSFDMLSKYESDRVIIRQSQKNGGYGYGNNYGVSIAKNEYAADYIFISNPDVRFGESIISSFIDAFLMDNNIAVVSAMQINGYSNKEIKNCCWRIPTYGDYLRSSLLMLGRLNDHRYDLDRSKEMQEVGCVPGAFLAVDADKFALIGGYDERIFLFCEESTLGYKVKQYGFKTVILTNQYYYHYHSTSIKKSVPKELSRHKMILRSRMFYISNYLQVSKFKQNMARFIFKCSVAEYALLYFVKK